MIIGLFTLFCFVALFSFCRVLIKLVFSNGKTYLSPLIAKSQNQSQRSCVALRGGHRSKTSPPTVNHSQP